MELISQRVAAGLDINPSKFAKARLSRTAPSPSVDVAESSSPRPKHRNSQPKDMSDRWKQLGSAIDSSKSFLQEGKHLLSRMQVRLDPKFLWYS